MTGLTQPGPGCGGRGADNAGVSDLLSTLLAGGLSAGLFLLWWPHHFPTTGLEWLVLRGVAWTLAFEVLLLAFRPLERLAWSRAHASVTTRAPRVRAALGVGVTPRAARPGPAVALALAAFAVPAALLAGGAQPIAAPASASGPHIVRQVIVKRPVIRREVIVRRVASAPAAVATAPILASTDHGVAIDASARAARGDAGARPPAATARVPRATAPSPPPATARTPQEPTTVRPATTARPTPQRVAPPPISPPPPVTPVSPATSAPSATQAPAARPAQ